MVTSKKMFFVLTLILYVISALANVENVTASQDEEHRIVFASREFIPVQNKGALSEVNENQGGEEKAHILVQFYDAVSTSERDSLKKNGVMLLESLNNDVTWFASLPKTKVQVLENYENVRWAGNIHAEDKLQDGILQERYPFYSINNDNTRNVKVICFEDVSEEVCEESIRKYGIITGNAILNKYVVKISKAMIQELAKQDSIKRVEVISGTKASELDEARKKVQVKPIQMAPYQLDGLNVTIAIWEAIDGQTGGSKIDRYHEDIKNRIVYGDLGEETSVHGTMVGVIAAGDGTFSSLYKGMAIRSDLISYDVDGYIDDSIQEHLLAIEQGALISQNSWGVVVSEADGNCDTYGNYEDDEINYDSIVRGDKFGKPMTIIFSAGNERNQGDCGLQDQPYNSTNQPHTAKNIITVGATYSDSNELTCFSSFGPTDDGRLKPDIVAPGDEETCALSDEKGIEVKKSYSSAWRNIGTSFAAPQVSGIAALMYQQFQCMGALTNDPLPSTIKALLLHTATDINETGPDYASGYGLINATKAIDHIIYRYFREDNLSSANDEDKFNFTINDSGRPIKVTLVWDDQGGKDTDTDHLRNDLNLFLRAPNGSVFQSWTLDPENPAAPATKDGNHRDNVEQVYVENPGEENLQNEGEWQIIVNATDGGDWPQKYSLVYKRPWEMKLKPGWNWVSIPVRPYNSSTTHIFGNSAGEYNVSSVFEFEAKPGEGWSSYVPGAVTNTLTEMTMGLGYYVNVTPSARLEINGDPITQNNNAQTTNIELFEGFNFIGFNSFFEVASNESFSGINVSKFLRERGDGKWDAYYANETFEQAPFNLVPGMGAELHVNQGANWTIPLTSSCSVLNRPEVESAVVLQEKESPFVVYGSAQCTEELSKITSNVDVKLRVGGVEVANYTMGAVDVNQYRLQVALGADANEDDTAEFLINNVSSANITIGASGDFYYFNVSANGTTDDDGDGFSAECSDCNDDNASIHANAAEVCDDGVDNNCNALVDCADSSCATHAACLAENITVSVLREIASVQSMKTIELGIFNNGEEFLDNITWSLDLGDGTVLSGVKNTSLAADDTAFVYVEHNYSAQGDYVLSATAKGANLTAVKTLPIEVEYLAVNELIAIHGGGSLRVFEANVSNWLAVEMTNVTWRLDTGEENISSVIPMLLRPNENVSIYVEHNYSGTGTFVANFTVMNNTWMDWEAINVTIT